MLTVTLTVCQKSNNHKYSRVHPRIFLKTALSTKSKLLLNPSLISHSNWLHTHYTNERRYPLTLLSAPLHIQSRFTKVNIWLQISHPPSRSVDQYSLSMTLSNAPPFNITNLPTSSSQFFSQNSSTTSFFSQKVAKPRKLLPYLSKQYQSPIPAPSP